MRGGGLPAGAAAARTGRSFAVDVRYGSRVVGHAYLHAYHHHRPLTLALFKDEPEVMPSWPHYICMVSAKEDRPESHLQHPPLPLYPTPTEKALRSAVKTSQHLHMPVKVDYFPTPM